MNVSAREKLTGILDEIVYEFVVLLACDTRLIQA